MKCIELPFVLKQIDGWPPFGKEFLQCEEENEGFRVKVSPFFVQNVSVGDLLYIELSSGGDVKKWSHIKKSGNSTVWLKIVGEVEIEKLLDCVKSFGCNVERITNLGYFSIDVPAHCSLDSVDDCVNALGEGHVLVAYSSLRHE